jgi:glyoxylase-like metal-dependent hydrolase (beta-lactamase superfamily II)
VVRLGDAPVAGRGGGGIQRAPTAIIVSHENLLNRISAPTGVAASEKVEFWPTNTFFTARKTLWYNDEPVEIIHEPAAHTDGDVMAFFRRSDVVAAGPIIDTLAYPVPDTRRGGSIGGILKGLNDVIDIAVPKYNQQGGTKIAPGRGRILNEADVVEYRDMMTIIRNRVKDAVDRGQTLQQVQALGPTLEYDPLYSSPKLTGQQLVETIYNDLKGAAAPARR